MAVLKEGVQRTVSQTRQMVGTLQKDPEGGHSVVRKKGDTFQFVVNKLDSPEDKFPSMEEIAQADFSNQILGDVDKVCNVSMAYGVRPEAHPDKNPIIASFRANLVPGGILFMTQSHHFVNGLTGYTSFIRLVSENCYAIANKTEPPLFDAQCLNRRLFGSLGFEQPNGETQAEPPTETEPQQLSHTPERRIPMQSLFFHLPKSKAALLKEAASPTDGTWISTYNAVCALIWRVTCKIRAPLYKADPTFKPLFGSGVDIKKFFTDPPMPYRTQGNLQFDITSASSHLPEYTLAEVVSEAPLSKLASYIRHLTDGVTSDMIHKRLQKFANLSDKQKLSIRVEAFPPLAVYVTDWRSQTITEMDFGFAHPIAFRCYFAGQVTKGLGIIYPPRREGPAGSDEGIELNIPFEVELTDQLLNDPDWSKYFEFRGVDIKEGA